MARKYEEIAIDCDYHSVQPISNSYTGAAIVDATVKGQIKDMAGVNVGGEVTYAYQANGEYLGVFPSTTTGLLEEGERYDLWITVSGTANDVRRIPFYAVYREQI